METRPALAERPPLEPAPPFVSYATMSEATVGAETWPALYPALQALKGHVQEYPGCQSMEVYVRPDPDGVFMHCYTIWDTPSQLEAFLERGYTFERLLADFGGLETEKSLIMERVF
jgi:hypothetical protein